MLSFYFESYEGDATIKVTDAFTGELIATTSGSTACSPLYLHIGSTPGTFLITITTRSNTYEGWFTLD